MAWIFLRESKTMPQLTERMMMKKLRRGLACLAAAALGVTALSPLGVSAPEQPGMYVAQETDDSITYAYNRTNSDYDYLTLNQNKFYTWDVRDTNLLYGSSGGRHIAVGGRYAGERIPSCRESFLRRRIQWQFVGHKAGRHGADLPGDSAD